MVQNHLLFFQILDDALRYAASRCGRIIAATYLKYISLYMYYYIFDKDISLFGYNIQLY